MNRNLQITLSIIIVALVLVGGLFFYFGDEVKVSLFGDKNIIPFRSDQVMIDENLEGVTDTQPQDELSQETQDFPITTEEEQDDDLLGVQDATDTIALVESATDTEDFTEAPPEEEKAPPAPELVIVIYNDDGFSPREVEVAIGGTVRFLNSSKTTMWVASDDHPDHLMYPEFDQGSAVGLGGAYEFVFTQSGDWGYHNHHHASDGGIIHVIGETEQ